MFLTGKISPTKELATWVSELKYGDIPKDVLTSLKETMVDAIGSMLGGSTNPIVKILIKYANSIYSQGESTVLTFGDKLDPYHTALINGTAGHAWDIDPMGPGHHMYTPSIAAALALGERELISGKEFLRAIVAGCEVQCRIANAGRNPDGGPGRSEWGNGWSGMGTLGPWGTSSTSQQFVGTRRG